MRLEDKKAVVTGAASGIGRATAQLFAAEGADVLAVDRAGELPGEHAGIDRIRCLVQDLTEKDAGARVAQAANEQLGGCDILFNNAGISRRALVDELTVEDWDAVIATNLSAYFHITRALIPQLKTSGCGRIISTASVMARMTDYGLAAYCAAKAGVAGFTRSLALDLGKHAITANYIEPGAIRTGLTREAFADDHIAEVWAKKAALRRLGEPEDIARAVLFLASDDARFVTGHGLVVDGGLTLRT